MNNINEVLVYKKKEVNDNLLGDFTINNHMFSHDETEVINDIETTTFKVKVREENSDNFFIRELIISNKDLSLVNEDEITNHHNIEQWDIGYDFFDLALINNLFPLNEDHDIKSFKEFTEQVIETAGDDELEDYYIVSQHEEDDVITAIHEALVGYYFQDKAA